MRTLSQKESTHTSAVKSDVSVELASRFLFKKIDIREMPILTKRVGASTFQEVFTRRSIELLRLASASDNFFLSTHYLVFLKIVAQKVVQLLVSVSHYRSCRKLHWSPFGH